MIDLDPGYIQAHNEAWEAYLTEHPHERWITAANTAFTVGFRAGYRRS